MQNTSSNRSQVPENIEFEHIPSHFAQGAHRVICCDNSSQVRIHLSVEENLFDRESKSGGTKSYSWLPNLKCCYLAIYRQKSWPDGLPVHFRPNSWSWNQSVTWTGCLATFEWSLTLILQVMDLYQVTAYCFSGAFPSHNIMKVASDIANALYYLHDTKKLLHGDIKSANVLIKVDICCSYLKIRSFPLRQEDKNR